VLASLAAAACYALSAVLQQSAAAEQDPELSLRPGLLFLLLRRRRWLLGIVAGVAGYAFQFVALRRGALALVQPLLVASLVIALPLSAVMEHRRLSRLEWLPGLLIISSLALFLIAARPGRGAPRASDTAWAVLGLLTLIAVAACVLNAGPSGARRALLLGAGAGLLFGVTGAVTEATGHLLNHGIGQVFTHWPPYAVVVVGVGGLLLNQSAFQAGALRWSLPVITILEPLVAIAIGELMFSEHIATGALARVGEILGLIGMVIGIFMLARPQPPATPAGLVQDAPQGA
jgi:drug/metabolite transporter (DMT)-like permease